MATRSKGNFSETKIANSRRVFLKASVGVGVTAAIGPYVATVSAAPQVKFMPWPPAEQKKVSDALKTRMRSLADERLRLVSDNALMNSLTAWLTKVTLAQDKYSLQVSKSDVYQLSMVRPNCHGYLIHIADNKFLTQLLDKGRKRSKNFDSWWRKSGAKTQTPSFATLMWFRQIVPDRKERKTPFRLRETYYLIVWAERKFGDLRLLYPIAEVTDAAIDFPRALSLYWKNPARAINLASDKFFDASVTMQTWHQVAAAFGLRRSIPYLRACFASAGYSSDVWARQANLDNDPQAPEYQGTLVYTPADTYGQNAQNYQMPLSITDASRIRPGIHSVGDLRQATDAGAVLTALGPRVGARYQQEAVRSLQALSANWPAAQTPHPDNLAESTSAGKEFIAYAQLMSGGAATYVGAGMFAVSVQVPQNTAAEVGVRSSAPTGGVAATVFKVGPAAAAGAGAGATVGIAVHELAGWGWDKKFGEHLRELEELAKREAERCAESATQSETCPAGTTSEYSQSECCRQCVMNSTQYEQLREFQNEREMVSTAAGAAAAAGTGCVIGGIGGAGVFSVPACAVGALLALAAYGAYSFFSYLHETGSMDEEVFSACREHAFN